VAAIIGKRVSLAGADFARWEVDPGALSEDAAFNARSRATIPAGVLLRLAMALSRSVNRIGGGFAVNCGAQA